MAFAILPKPLPRASIFRLVAPPDLKIYPFHGSRDEPALLEAENLEDEPYICLIMPMTI